MFNDPDGHDECVGTGGRVWGSGELPSGAFLAEPFRCPPRWAVIPSLHCHGQGKLVTAHFYFKVLNRSMMTNRAGSMDMARCLYAF